MSEAQQNRALAALKDVLASRSFIRAEQLRRLLTYLVHATLESRGSSLKESVIGVEVFDRSAGFNPRNDPTVRMALRRLRSHLGKYYQGEGSRLQSQLSYSADPKPIRPSSSRNRDARRLSLDADRSLSGS